MAEPSTTSAAMPAAEKNAAVNQSATDRWQLAGAIALMSWSCFRFPQATLSSGLDPSWTAVLIYAHEKGLQFGRDIVYTYGPLGFLSIECFSPHAAVVRILFEIVFGIGIATGLSLVAWRLPSLWRFAVLGYFMLVSSPAHWGGDALFADLGLFAWGLLCFLEDGPKLRFFLPALAVLAAIGALVKFTFLITGALTIALLACDLAFRRRFKLAAGMVIVFLLTFMFAWLFSGQKLSGLGAFLFTSWEVASGYNEAMVTSSVPILWVSIMIIAALLAVIIRVCSLRLAAGPESPVRRPGILLLWLVALLFAEWKYACVRTDWYHAALVLGMVPIVGLSMEALPCRGQRALLLGRAASVLSVLAALLFIQSQVHGFALGKCLGQAGKNMSASFNVLTQPWWYLHEKEDALAAQKKTEQLPKIRAAVGGATADVFGQNQVLAIFNELNYQPRPAFQSFGVYNRPLMELNERHFLSNDAPEFVLFNLQAIDGRFPPLEDSYVLRDLLGGYVPVLEEGDYLLLRRAGPANVQMTLLKEGNVRASETIALPDPDSGIRLWMEIELRPSFIGRLRQFIYKPPQTQLAVWSESGAASPLKYNAPPTMLSAGFIASPLILDTKSLTAGARAKSANAFSVEIPEGSSGDWQPEIHFRIYRIEK